MAGVARGGGGAGAGEKPVMFAPQQRPAQSAASKDEHNSTTVDVPPMIYDPTPPGHSYSRGKLLGRGGFARCFEVTNTKTNAIYACKVVNKQLLIKPHQREKMAQEIQIHRKLSHIYIVDFLSYFEDHANVYITLELCSKKSLMELQKRRRAITEPEAKYFMKQIVEACKYLHDEKHIIHRDLKLGNIFIAENMCLKIGDFGLATTIEFDGERKKTLCGTPNYIAPEVLAKKGHSYEVDIWSIGCILYTLLIGRPPFETATLRDTYHKIKRGEYYYPQNMNISQSAKMLLARLLQVNPAVRPNAKQILNSDFMTQGTIPTSLPPSVLTMAPRFDRNYTKTAAGVVSSQTAQVQVPKKEVPQVRPLTENNQRRPGNDAPTRTNTNRAIPPPSRPLALNTSQDVGFGELTSMDILEHMKNLRDLIQNLIDKNPKTTIDDDESEDPSSSPLVWICKWVDYSDKYGFGYHLSDDSIGVSFNDQTKIILLSDSRSMHYIGKSGKEQYHKIDDFPDELVKKVKLLKYFQQYMQDNLMKATGGRENPPSGCIARVPNMWTWFRTSRAVVMVLSNGTLQINNFRDHSKIIVCPMLGALSTLGSNQGMRTFKLSSMEKGMSKEMAEKLKYALEKVNVVLSREVDGSEAPIVFSSGSGKESLN